MGLKAVHLLPWSQGLAFLQWCPCAGHRLGPLHPYSLTPRWSNCPIVQMRTLRTKRLGGHGHTDRNDWQSENLDLAGSGQF